jgi:hypothetical protein
VSHDALLTRLARLDAQDRAWLLGELPADMRRELLAELNEDGNPGAAPPAAARGWESLDARRVAEMLEHEPVWLISGATRAADLRWRERLLQHLSSRRRHEVELADRAGRPLNARAAQRVLEICGERIAHGGSVAGASAARGGFAALVDQMRSRFA